MNIKSTKFFAVLLVVLLVLWRVVYVILSAKGVFEQTQGTYINYSVIILLVCTALLTAYFINNYTDMISKSYWVTGNLVSKKRGAFNSFNRAQHYNYSRKTYFKFEDDQGKEHYLVGLFISEDRMMVDHTYTVRVRSKRIIDIK